ncbi:hypothetical protein K2173_003209 [Erythroxylum novogranatense]|uniref:Transmembrane protein n=1 Tax=Erythroxylum novogranatense TaxID=1862640 RepID=A0AAV8SXV7_9ROSI|nr:hypothetical protein K2173_003209 [Erythroxylum novogranatense]
MELENNPGLQKHNLGVFGILTEALILSTQNINFLIFTLLVSLPLFFFSIYYEIFLQTTLVEANNILTPPPGQYHRWLPIPGYLSKLDESFIYRLIQLLFLHLIPLHLIEFSTVLVTVDLASKLITKEKPMTLKEMIHKPIHSNILRGTFITSIYTLALYACTLPGLIWFPGNCYVNLENNELGVPYSVFYGVASAVVLVKFLEWSVVWNMSIVISVLDEKVYAARALVLSDFLSKGRKSQGRFLMLVFVACGVGLRLPCLYSRCNASGSGIIAQISLLCMVNVIKWVAFLIYFYDCKWHKLEKKVDEQVTTRDIEAVHERQFHGLE